jgi:hypothetical protein
VHAKLEGCPKRQHLDDICHIRYNSQVEIFGTDEFEAWYLGLEEAGQETIDAVVEKLGVAGVQLPFPHSCSIEGTREPLRELRPKAGRSPLRVFYAFDPHRDAVLLLGGDKSGDPKFYKRMTAKAEAIWREYLKERSAAKKSGQEDL